LVLKAGTFTSGLPRRGVGGPPIRQGHPPHRRSIPRFLTGAVCVVFDGFFAQIDGTIRGAV